MGVSVLVIGTLIILFMEDHFPEMDEQRLTLVEVSISLPLCALFTFAIYRLILVKKFPDSEN
jgi:hypothetical protein